jgi:hypothetical protein
MTRYAAIVATAILVGSAPYQSAVASTQGPLRPQSHAVVHASGSHGWFASNANAKHPWLYVASANDITVYDLGSVGSPLLATITQGVSTPGGIALDAHGTLYVPNETANTVTVYPARATTPSMTLTGADNPVGVAVAANGDVYVSNRDSNPGVFVYLKGQTTPSKHITSSLLMIPNQVTFDSMGTLYISDNNSGVSVLPPGSSQTVTSLHLTGYGSVTGGVIVDPLTGNLLVSDSTPPPDYISLYGPGQQGPTRTRTLHFGGLDFLAIGTVRGVEEVFVPNSQGNFIYVLKPNLIGNPGVITTASNRVAISVAFKAGGVP